MSRRRLSRASCVLAALPLACTLSARPSDYFDPSGNAVMLARFDEGAPENLALTEGAVYASVGSRVVRVDKRSGEVRTIVDLTSPPAGITTGMPGRVVVCDRERGVLVFDASPPFVPIPVSRPSGDRGCLAVAANEARIAYVPELPPDATTDETPEVDQIFASGATATTTIPFGKQGTADAPPVPSIAVSGDQTLVFLRGGIGRGTATDICVVLRADSSKVRPQKLQANATVTIAMGGGDHLHSVAAGTQCCPKSSPSSCDRAPVVAVPSPVDWALTASYLYALSEGAVSRRVMARLADTSSDADERFPITGGTALVVEADDSAAYVSVGTRLVRRAMR